MTRDATREEVATARGLCVERAGDEGKSVWTDPKMTVCEELTSEGCCEVVLHDFKAG